MPIQEIPLELDPLLQKSGLAYWQATNNRRCVTVLSPWAQQILGEKAGEMSEKEDWFQSIHPSDREATIKTIESNDGTEVYKVDYRWADAEGSYIWLREIGRRKTANSPDFEGLLFTIKEQKELEQKALTISEREKRKLGRELHDDLCQQLAGMLFFTNNLVYQIKTGKNEDALVEATNEIKKQLQLSIEKTRCLSHGLNPVNLERKTFQECLIELIQQSQTLYSINCQFQMNSDLTIEDQEVATHLFRITQESINNAICHGNADTISITLQKEDNFGILTIRDNGSGFKSDPQNTDGMGLHNLRSRARMINGTIHIGNNDQGGASVHCKFSHHPTKL
jgi:signal transduction histidine kinase